MARAEHAFAAAHPAAAGHFPGNPVMPGAVVLAETLRAVQAARGASHPACRIESAKFLAPVRPGDHIAIEYSGDAGGPVRFVCSVGGRAVLRGVAAWSAEPKPA